MSIITLPVNACKRSQPLDIFYHNLVDFRYNKGVLIDVQIDTNNAILTGSFDLPMADIEAIIINGGTVRQMLTAFHVTDWTALKATIVPNTLPWYLNMLTGIARTFTNWLNQGEVWYKANEAIFYSNPRSKNAEDYLYESHIKIINDMSMCNQITIESAEVLIAQGGWTKYV